MKNYAHKLCNFISAFKDSDIRLYPYFLSFLSIIFLIQSIFYSSPAIAENTIANATTNQTLLFDIDGDGETKPLTDGLLVLRYLFNFRGDTLVSGAVANNASRKSAADIENHLNNQRRYFDIDGDGTAKPLTDGLLLLRYLFNFRGDSLINSVVEEDATRKTATDIEVYIKKYCNNGIESSFSFKKAILKKIELSPKDSVYFDFTLEKNHSNFDQVQLFSYVSTDTEINESDFEITGYGIDNNDFSNSQYSSDSYIKITIPETSGDYYVGICAKKIWKDGQVAESIRVCSTSIKIHVSEEGSAFEKAGHSIYYDNESHELVFYIKPTASTIECYIGNDKEAKFIEYCEGREQYPNHKIDRYSLAKDFNHLASGDYFLTVISNGQRLESPVFHLPPNAPIYAKLPSKYTLNDSVTVTVRGEAGTSIIVNGVDTNIVLKAFETTTQYNGEATLTLDTSGAAGDKEFILALKDTQGGIGVSSHKAVVEKFTSLKAINLLVTEPTLKIGEQIAFDFSSPSLPFLQETTESAKDYGFTHVLSTELVFNDGSTKMVDAENIALQVIDTSILLDKGIVAISSTIGIARKLRVLEALKAGNTTIIAKINGVSSSPVVITVKENDATSPIITLLGDKSVTIKQGEIYTDAGATATDEEDGDLKVTISGNINSSKIGSYSITYTVIDSDYNKITKTRTVNVIANNKIKESDYFITTWKTDNEGESNNKQIKIKSHGSGGYNIGSYNVDWGDGIQDINITSQDILHTYTDAGIYTIKIWGNFSSIYFKTNGYTGNSSTSYKPLNDNLKLLSVEQWGNIQWNSMWSAFSGCSNLKINAPDTPNLSNVKSMQDTFSYNSSENLKINNWDVSNVTNMGSMFAGATHFNANIGEWNVSNVLDMYNMFHDAKLFNQSIENWNTANVKNMNVMFFGAESFNQNIGNWDVSRLTEMKWMFRGAKYFNQDISNWNVSNVTDMDGLFFYAESFNQDISKWNVSKITNMHRMFWDAKSFNQDLNTWNVSNVTNMEDMFSGAKAFNGAIGNWDVSNVTDMKGMFTESDSFNQNIGGWDVSNVTNMSAMFRRAKAFNQDISAWDVSNVNNMAGMFWDADSFNQKIGKWNIFNVNDMSVMFSGANSFNGNIDNWDVSNVTNMDQMLYQTFDFSNHDLSSWSVSHFTTKPSNFNQGWGSGNIEPYWGKDKTPPVITLLGDNPATIKQGETYTDAGASASDAIDGVIAISTSGDVDISKIGTYTLTYTAIDKTGNKSTTTRRVSVIANNTKIAIADIKLLACVRTEIELTETAIPTSEQLLGLTSLTCSNKGLSNENITELKELVNLKTLDLSDNQITDSSPFASLTNLTALYLQNNQITHSSPFASLTDLTILHLQNNQISDSTPFASLTKLTGLSVSDNKISDSKPFASLTNLTILYLQNNQITDSAPFASLINLTLLYLQNNQITDSNPFASLTNLTTLHLQNNKISNSSPFASLTNLTGLSLSNNTISDGTPFASLTNLTLLYLNSNQITDTSSFASLTSLTNLYLSDNQIIDISPLVPLKQPYELSISGNCITNTSMLPSTVTIIGFDQQTTECQNTTDKNAPIITVLGDNPVTIKQGETYTDKGAMATDGIDGIVTVSSSGIVNSSKIGNYTLTYTAKDKAGNVATEKRMVYVIGNIDPRQLQKQAVVTVSTNTHEKHLTVLRQDFNTVIESNNNQWARYNSEIDFHQKLLIDLGGGDKESTQSHLYNPHKMHHSSWYQDSGYLDLTFKDENGTILHTFKFDKSGSYNSGYIEFDGERHNVSNADFQTSLHGYLLIEKGSFVFDSEYLLDDSEERKSGLESKTWTMTAFDTIKRVEISFGTQSIFKDGYSQIPLVFFYDRLQADENRTLDGSNNNPNDTLIGSAGTPLRRIAPSDYSDFISSLAGSDRPNPRDISNKVSAQLGSMPNPYQASDYVWAWGQFLDHDIDLTESAEPEEIASIPVPMGDKHFDPRGTGIVVIPFKRSIYDESTGSGTHNPRQQINQISAWIDASNVYGSNLKRANALRTLDGTGRLKTSVGNLLPFNTEGFPNAGGSGDTLFFAGDVRANEQASLSSLHTLFMREHNRLVALLTKQYPALSGEQLYQKARKLVGAEMQQITYNEYLPTLLGKSALKPYSGYQRIVDASITNIFSGAAYRYGHSALNPTILRLDAEKKTLKEGNLSLRNAFFSPKRLTDEGGIEPILRGLGAQVCQSIDSILIDDVRNFLFGQPGSGGFDLASLNIQRGRDHGLPSYNNAREKLGLARKKSVYEISADSTMRTRLANAYSSIDDIDIWVGGLSEDPVEGALVGEFIQTVLVRQFEALRDGDRFWYQYDLSTDELALVEGVLLSDVIRRNTSIDQEISDDVFKVMLGE